MDNGLVFILGIGIAAGLLYLVMHALDEEKHGILKFLMMMSILALLLMMPKAFVDAQSICETVVSNSTAVNSSTTMYTYESFCFTNTTTTPGTFMNVMFWIYRAFIAYIIVYLAIQALKALAGMRSQP